MLRLCPITEWSQSCFGDNQTWWRLSVGIEDTAWSVYYEYSNDGKNYDRFHPSVRSYGNMFSLFTNLTLNLKETGIKNAVDAIISELVKRLNITPTLNIDDPYLTVNLDDVGKWIDRVFQTSLIADSNKVIERLFPENIKKPDNDNSLIHDSLLCTD